MSFIHPGRLYLQKKGPIKSVEDIFTYADFLRKETGLDGMIPLDIDAIYAHFGIPDPKLAPLPDQQGLLFDPERGVIIINSKDPQRRQNFSKAHELVEFVFSELPQGVDLGGGWFLKRPGGFKENTKESLCNQTAANLLMPPKEIQERIRLYGSNFECGQMISSEFEVSLSAALIQVARLSPDRCVVVLWRMKNKPTELRNQSPQKQLAFSGFDLAEIPPKRLRVEWSLGGPNSPYVPVDKSVEKTSLIFSALEKDIFTSGDENLTFDGRTYAKYHTENQPFEVEGESMVLSFVRWLVR